VVQIKAERQVRNLEQVGSLGRGKPSTASGNTLQVREENDCDGFFLKTMSGGDVKAPSPTTSEKTWRREIPGGDRVRAVANYH